MGPKKKAVPLWEGRAHADGEGEGASGLRGWTADSGCGGQRAERRCGEGGPRRAAPAQSPGWGEGARARGGLPGPNQGPRRARPRARPQGALGRGLPPPSLAHLELCPPQLFTPTPPSQTSSLSRCSRLLNSLRLRFHSRRYRSRRPIWIQLVAAAPTRTRFEPLTASSSQMTRSSTLTPASTSALQDDTPAVQYTSTGRIKRWASQSVASIDDEDEDELVATRARGKRSKAGPGPAAGSAGASSSPNMGPSAKSLQLKPFQAGADKEERKMARMIRNRSKSVAS